MDAKFRSENGRHSLTISEGHFEWREVGQIHFHGIRGAYFWLDPSLKRFFLPLTEEIGQELFALLVARSSSVGTQDDYDGLVAPKGDLKEGVLSWGRAVSTAGWCSIEIPEFDEEKKRAVVVVRKSWELALQTDLPQELRWGSPFLQGKIMGILSIGFGTNCWADAIPYDGLDEQDIAFLVAPSNRTIGHSLSQLRRNKMRTEARLLHDEVERKTGQLREAKAKLRQHADQLESLVKQQTAEIVERNKALLRSQEEVHSILQTAPNLILSVDREGHILFNNQPSLVPEASNLWDLPFKELGREILASALQSVFRSGETEEVSLLLGSTDEELEYLFKLGPLIEGGKITSVTLVGTDITDRRRLEEQLSHAQKLESLGQLAGGVAHDFNNMLTAIIGAVEMAQGELSDRPGTKSLLDTVLDVGMKGSALVRELMAFSRKGERVGNVTEVLDLNNLVESSSLILERTLSDQIEIALTLHPEPLPIQLGSGQLEQVLLNLAINAEEAMPSGGSVTISTSLVTDACRPPFLRQNKPYAQLDVRDTGAGMPPEVRRRIFDPFYTTKPLGKGTGLGLSTSYQIVDRVGGFWEVESAEGQGTRFTIYLPLSDQPIAHTEPEADRSISTYPGSETLLLIEDDESVRRMNKRYLQKLGYRVLEATNGRDALDSFGQELNDIDMVVTDIMMPKMNGVEFVKEARQRLPRLPVLYVSGYSEDLLPSDEENLLSKPYSPNELGQRVRQTLDLV